MKAIRPVLLIGATGQVGTAIAKLYPGIAAAAVHPLVVASRGDLDLQDEKAIRRFVREHAPIAIVNAAAYTAVDRAEAEPALCFAINAAAPIVMAEEAVHVGSTLFQYSTDYVFDGTAESYVETDPVAPLNVYGETKVAAERGIAGTGARWFGLRTA